VLQTVISREKIVEYFQCLSGGSPVPTQLFSLRQTSFALSQRTQIIWHLAELPDHFGIVEIACGRITSARKCHRTTAFFARERSSAHYNGRGIEAFRGFAICHAIALTLGRGW
jgi:hypothetical protein